MFREVKPTLSQLKWSDCELGVIIHYDITVFEPEYEFRRDRGYHPSTSIFNPSQLNTDQWIETAKDAGAKYAILVAKHCTGFCLWPTKAHEYSVKHTPWRSGNGDIVADFINSCKKYDIKPGLYYSVSCNAYFGVDNPGKVLSNNKEDQENYNKMVIEQVTELWTSYGDMFEIWFDGGVISPEEGGPDIEALLNKYQPQAVCFQGPSSFPSLLRWVGNEEGLAPETCWSTTSLNNGNFAGDVKFPEVGIGDPDGMIWAPAETDMPNRNFDAFGGGWFWREEEERYLHSVDHLVDCYYNSVGRNTNLLIGMVIDNRGLVPDADVEQFKEFGQEVSKRIDRADKFSTSGKGNELLLDFKVDTEINHICIMENIINGESIREFIVEGYNGEKWVTLCSGQSIGHKRIERINRVKINKARIKVLKSTSEANIITFSAWLVDKNK